MSSLFSLCILCFKNFNTPQIFRKYKKVHWTYQKIIRYLFVLNILCQTIHVKGKSLHKRW